MAVNKILLGGIVAEEPNFAIGTIHSDALEVTLDINRRDIGKVEKVSFLIFDEKLIYRATNEIHKGDYCMMEGRVITTNYVKTKTIICPHCQDVQYEQTKGERTEIECFAFQVTHGTNLMDSIGLNKVYLLGNVCSNLNYRPGVNNGRDYIKYKLAVNRPKHEKLRPNDIREKNADFPFIVSFNGEATTAEKYLNQSALLIVEGSIQEREIKQKKEVICHSCNTISTPFAKSIVREIITSKVDYITLGNHNEAPKQMEDIEELHSNDEQ